jgi:hypothetical protein
MTELRDFENALRATLTEVADSADEPPGLADRLVTGATQRRVPHRMQVWLGRRWVPPALAAAAVAVVAVATVATVTAVRADRPAGPTHPDPAPNPTVSSPTPSVTPTSSATPTSSGPSSTARQSTHSPAPSRPYPPQTSATTGTTDSPPPAASGRWTDSPLVITAHSLGAVTRGMTLAEAKAAAGTSLSLIGDSTYRPTDHTITGSTTLQFSWGATCFDATRSASGPGTTVTTSAGVRLGDPVSRIAAAYGSLAKPFTADPAWTGAGNIPAGIIVQAADGVLLFVGSSPDGRGGTVTSIRGAADAFHASSVFC